MVNSKTSFTKDQLAANQINFVADGTTNEPTYNIQGYDGTDFTNTLRVDMTFILLPNIIINNMTIGQGESIILTTSIVNGIVSSCYIFPIFYVINVANGNFTSTIDPDVALTHFTVLNLFFRQMLV